MSRELPVWSVPIKRSTLEVHLIPAANANDATLQAGIRVATGVPPDSIRETSYVVLRAQKVISDQVEHTQDDQQDHNGQHPTEPVVAHERTVDGDEARLLTPPRKKP